MAVRNQLRQFFHSHLPRSWSMSARSYFLSNPWGRSKVILLCRAVFLSEMPWLALANGFMWKSRKKATLTFVGSLTRGLLMPTFQLLQGWDEGTESERWGDRMDNDKHSETLGKKTCARLLPALAGYIGIEPFLGAFGESNRKGMYLCPEAVMYATCLGHFTKYKWLELWTLRNASIELGTII